jgi:hypothetical protein
MSEAPDVSESVHHTHRRSQSVGPLVAVGMRNLEALEGKTGAS